MSRLIDIVGEKYNMLTVVERLPNDRSGSTVWLCKCDCGNYTKVRGKNLKNGAVKSCGCLKQISHTKTHGKSQTRIYNTWASMKSRCLNPNDNSYFRYGGRGICVCEEWINSFESFYDWSMKNGYTDSMTIERIDNNGNYCPENCRWATQKEQCRNRRTNAVFEYMGEKHILTEWCEILNLEYKLVHNRIRKHGWSFERAVSTPKTYSRK